MKVLDSESIAKTAQQLLDRVVKAGDSVIVGRGSQHFLRNREDTLRILLYTPKEPKSVVCPTPGKTQDEAEQLVDPVDRERAEFIQRYCNVEWPNHAH